MKRITSILIGILFGYVIEAQISDSTNTRQISLTDSTDVNDTAIYTSVDTVASFPGGKAAWNNYAGKNLDATVGLINGAKFGKYNVIIKFVVMKDGTLKDFQPVTKCGHGFEEEVIRVLKLSPRWQPAKKNNLKVNSLVKQSQMFSIEKG